MRIENSNISLYSESSFQFSHKSITSAQLHYAQNGNDQEQSDNNKLRAVSLDLSFSQSVSVESSRMVYDYEDNMSHEDKIKKLIVEKLLESLYGKHKKIQTMPHKKEQGVEIVKNPYAQNIIPQNRLIGIELNSTEEYYQKQTVDFSASVQINTPDKSFSLDLSLSYSKELYESHSSTLLIGDKQLIDPLVINYDTDINPFENLSGLKFEFDLDNDGQTDLVPVLKEGAGYLALDKNGNGTIDDGSELFGVESNNGFKDLGKFDQDNNNWIDENDEVFSKLKIWQKDDSENDRLISLVDLNVGAIYLGDVQSGYLYQSSIAQTDAVQKSNGIFLKEDGTGAGMINSIDITV